MKYIKITNDALGYKKDDILAIGNDVNSSVAGALIHGGNAEFCEKPVEKKIIKKTSIKKDK